MIAVQIRKDGLWHSARTTNSKITACGQRADWPGDWYEHKPLDKINGEDLCRAGACLSSFSRKKKYTAP